MREGDGKVGGKETIPESDAESVLYIIGQMLETGTFDSSRLPKDPVTRQRLDEIVVAIGKVQNFALCISRGDLDCRLDAKGISAGSLKFLHSNLRHLTWQAQQIAAGDFSQRVDFMGEFSEAFNHMVMALDAARAEMRQHEQELSSLNAQLLTEVTVRKQAEEHLDQQFRFLQRLTDTIPNPIFYKDANGVYTGCNTAFEKYIGLPKDQIAGKSVYDISPKELADKYFAKDRELFDHSGTQIYESRVKYADGSIHDVIFNKATFSDLQGNVQGLVGVIVDITERKKAEVLLKRFNEELEQKVKIRTEELNASLDEKVILLREVHHRVKNNLQILISLLNLQSRTITDPKVIAALKESTQRIRAMSMVHEKLYTGTDLAHIEFISYLSSLANSQVSFYDLSPGKVKLEINGGNIMLDINTAIPLGLVMNELVSNALKHAFPGDRKGTIRIDTRETEHQLEITFADDGVGLPEGFDAKVSPTLGLRLVNILVEQLSGTITLDRTKAGTMFHISIPKKER